MKKIVFLGCENTHSATFINFIQQNKKYSDIKILGVYSHDAAAAAKLSETNNVPIMSSYDDAVGKADGIVVTARHGDYHYKYAAPYMKKGMTIFVDKPITVKENEAVQFMKECRAAGVKVTGGSSLRFDEWISRLREDSENQVGGATLGGIIRCPVSMNNPNGGFFFYAQHLVESVGEVFGRYPLSVQAFKKEKVLTVIFRYDSYDVTGVFADECYQSYYAARFTKDAVKGAEFTVDGKNPCFAAEWDEFYELLNGAEQQTTYKDFIAPVFVMNAIMRSIESGKEEEVKGYEL